MSLHVFGPSRSKASYALPLLDRHEFPSAALDQRIAEFARYARDGDRAARDALFAAFQPKVDGAVSRFWHRAQASTVWELADLRQETFLVFADLVASWPGEGSFSAYFLRCFRGRLIDAIRRMDGRVRTSPLVGSLPESESNFDLVELRALLEESSAGWSVIDRAILFRHVSFGAPIAEIAAQLGIDPVVAFGRLRTIKARLRRLLRDDMRREEAAPT